MSSFFFICIESCCFSDKYVRSWEAPTLPLPFPFPAFFPKINKCSALAIIFGKQISYLDRQTVVKCDCPTQKYKIQNSIAINTSAKPICSDFGILKKQKKITSCIILTDWQWGTVIIIIIITVYPH